MKRIAESPKIRVAVAVGAPFATSGIGVKAVAERARDEVQTLVRRARARVETRA
jgi:hypothetical protein